MIKDKQISFGSSSLFSILKSVALIVALLFLLKMYFGERESRIEQQTLIEASAGELQLWKTKDGENLAKIQVLETRDRQTFLAFKSQDSTIQELQKLVKDNKKLFKGTQGSASVIKTETNIDAAAVTKVTQKTPEDSPVYTSHIKDSWYDIKTVATEEKTSVSLSTFHSMSLVVGSEGQGFLKKKKTFAIASDANPYSNIKDMKIYNVTEDKKKFVVGPYVGIGVGGSQGVVRTGWQIGLGLTYKIFEF